MIQSPRHIGIYILLALIFGFSVDLYAQDLSIRNSCLSITGNSNELSQGSKQFFIQESVGQSSVIGTSIGQNITLRQGFIQPFGSGAKAIEEKPLQIQVFPNPTTDMITIRALQDEGLIVEVSIFDLSGRLIVNLRDNLQNDISISLNSLATGMYVLRVTEAERLFTTNIQKL